MSSHRSRPARRVPRGCGWGAGAALLLAGALAGLLAPPAAAAPLGAPPVDELVREALARAPLIEARRAGVEAARRREPAAGALGDPRLALTLQDVSFPEWTVGEEEMSMIGPELIQDFPFPGKRGARRDAARAETAVAERELQSVRRAITFEVRRLYAELYVLDEELELLDVSRDLVHLLSTSATHHLETGGMDQQAVLKARLLGSRLEERRTDRTAERATRLAELNRFLDRPGDAPLGIVDALPAAAAPAALTDSVAESASAAVLERAADVSAAERELRAARLESRPDFSAGAGVGFRGDMDPVTSLRFGIDLPLWGASARRAAASSAAAELERARHELRDAQAAARAEAARLRAEWRRADEQVRRYEQSFVPQSSLVFDAARSAYVGGRSDFSIVLQDFDAWLDARTGLARRQADRFIAWAALESLLRDPEESAPRSGEEP